MFSRFKLSLALSMVTKNGLSRRGEVVDGDGGSKPFSLSAVASHCLLIRSILFSISKRHMSDIETLKAI